MFSGYIPILIMLIVAGLLAVAMVGGSFILGPKRQTHFKSSSYECGMTPVGNARERFPVQFYLIAMLFIIFDIETIFLYPWAVTFRNPETGGKVMKLFMLGEMGVFIAILFVGYFYVLGKGGFDWSADQEEVQDMKDQKIFAPRPPIRFGNENSGNVILASSRTPDGSHIADDSAASSPIAKGA